MNDHLTAFGILYGFALVPIVFAYLWSRLTAVPRNQRLLKKSAIACALIFLIIFGGFLAVVSQCGGNFLYGFVDCRIVSNQLAANLTAFTFLATIAGLAYAAFLFIFCAVMEISNARKS